jgi:hypothetical protein
MSTSAESPRNQAARFLAMAAEARDEGKPGVADFLAEIARRVAAAEPTLAEATQQETAVVHQQDGHAQHTE